MSALYVITLWVIRKRRVLMLSNYDAIIIPLRRHAWDWGHVMRIVVAVLIHQLTREINA